jgi:hypothetical protein
MPGSSHAEQVKENLVKATVQALEADFLVFGKQGGAKIKPGKKQKETKNEPDPAEGGDQKIE